jgi:NADH-quinone oxidoreductase subunit I
MKIKDLIKSVFMTEIGRGLTLTFKHMFVRKVTFQYPHEKRVIPDAHRGALSLLRYEDGTERCVGCDLCEAACPSHCIRVVSEEDKSNPLRRYASEFDIDMTKCVFCGFCVEACPVNALGMTKLYEYATEDKRELLFDKAKLYAIGEKYYDDAKAYLVAHRQETKDEQYRAYRYKFPSPVARKE